MANVILDMDLEHPALDENIRDWVKVFSTKKSSIFAPHLHPPSPGYTQYSGLYGKALP